MGMFSHLAEAKTSEVGRYFKPGIYEVKFKRVAREKSNKNAAVTNFKVITEVVSCEGIGGDPAPYKPGEEVNAIWNETKPSGPGNAKMFVRRASAQYALNKGATEDQIKALDADFNPSAPHEKNPKTGELEHPSEKHFAACVGPDSVLNNMTMRVECFNNPEGTFTNINWVARAPSKK